MATSLEAGPLSSAVLSFALDGRFPEDAEISASHVAPGSLSPAIRALEQARADLKVEINAIGEDTRDDVAAWVQEARALQEDIVRAKTMANGIVRQSEAPAASGKDIRDAEDRAEFIAREAQYADQLCWVLEGIRDANELLNRVEQARDQRRIVDSLHLLEQTWAAMDRIPASKTCRVMRLLDVRCLELKSDAHEVFDNVWKALVRVDVDNARISINATRDGEPMNLQDAVVGLEAYREVDERMEQLWHNLDATIVSPRMRRGARVLPAIRTADTDVLELGGESPLTIEALLSDLETLLLFLASRLPSDLLRPLCAVMMADLVPKLVRTWLDAEVPSSLRDIERFREVIAATERFVSALESHGFSGVGDLREWVGSAPSIWLAKCRETALDCVRTKLSAGIVGSKQVEKVERRTVKPDGDDAPNEAGAADVDWTADWGDEDPAEAAPVSAKAEKPPAVPMDDYSANAWGWDDDAGDDSGDDADAWGFGGGVGDEGGGNAEPESSSGRKKPTTKPARDPRPAQGEDDAWRFDEADGEEQTNDPPKSEHEPRPDTKLVQKAAAARPGGQEIVLRETYMISSMPDPVLELIFAILDDGVALTREKEDNPVAAAATELFSLPTSALALFRAVSPHFYSRDMGGNMYLYNDATYLAEQLSDFASRWKTRNDLSARARNMLRLDCEVKSLRGFANRSYSNELALQKTVLRDLLGGASSLMQQDEIESCVDSAIARVLAVASVWEPILARSVWAQAVGSLVDAVSAKLIADVAETPSIGQEEAYRIAGLIAKVTELDSLFLPGRLAPGPSENHGATGASTTTDSEIIPSTAQYASSWLRLKFLSEVLQANLNDVRFLWFESELSLHFNADEVVDLIESSFEPNERARGIIREIRNRPHPLGS